MMSECFAHIALAVFLKLERFGAIAAELRHFFVYRVALKALVLFSLDHYLFFSLFFQALSSSKLSISLIGVDFIPPLMILRPVKRIIQWKVFLYRACILEQSPLDQMERIL